MTINNYTFNQLWLQLERHRDLYPRIVAVLLGIYLLNYAAMLTWRMVPTDQTATALSSGNKTVIKATNAKADINGIKNLYLFGHPQQQSEAPKVVEVEDAPETNLNLTLTGAVASTNESEGAAIVENRGQQNTYGLGDVIDGTRATVDKVFADRIIINNGGRKETLMLDGIDYQQQNNSRRPGIPQALSVVRDTPRQQPTVSPAIREAREQLTQQPESFTDYISISPETRNGQAIGYRVQPGKKPALFNAAGLENNDIITELNGLDLTDPQQAMEAMSSLQNEQSLQITVNRNDELLTLYLDLPQSNEEF